MTHGDHVQADATRRPHPFVCPNCGRRTGVVNMATGISICAICKSEWRGPRLTVSRPPADPAATATWGQTVADEVLHDK